MAEIREVANVLIGLGDGDTDPGRVYMQQMIVNDWVSFPVESLPEVIAALQAIAIEAASREAV